MSRKLVFSIIVLLIVLVTVTLVVYRPIRKRSSIEVVFAERKTLLLNKDWYVEVFKGKEFPKSPPSGDSWNKVDIPYLIHSKGYWGAWFKKTITVPELKASGRILLVFYGVKYKCRVYLNGKLVAEHSDGFTPFTVDITDIAKNGENELLVCVLDWTSTLTKEVDLTDLKPGERPVDKAVNAILYPIGSLYTRFGIWDDVELKIVPSIWIKDVYIKTFYRNSTISVEVTIRNDYSQNLEVTVVNKVFDKDKEVLTLPSQTVLVKARQETKITVFSIWKNPKLWAPWSPHLYNLSTVIFVSGKKVDEKITRFGFREFWVEDGSYYLNGIKITLRMASTHPLGYTREVAFSSKLSQEYLADISRHAEKTVLETYSLLKNLSVNAMRLHAQPWRKIWYDLADEKGVLIVHESAVWCLGRSYRVGDPQFWENFKEHLKGQILLHRNHPSIIIWSIENELLLTGGRFNPKTEKRLAELAQFVKSLDPTRPVMYEGDFDPCGAADIINLHYPHELQKHDDYPNTAYWPLRETLLDSYPHIPWQWNKSKPLHIGEFLWIPMTTHDISAVFFGDIVYRNPAHYHSEAKALVWRYQIIAYRVLRVSGFCPWNIFEGGPSLRKVVKETYKPVAVFPLNYDNSFYENKVVERTLALVNDHYRKLSLKLKCILHYRNASKVVYEKTLKIDPSEAELIEFNFTTPAVVNAREEAYLEIELYNGSSLLQDFNTTIYIYKEIYCEKCREVLLLGSDTGTEEALRELGVNIIKADENLPEKGLIVVARNSLKNVNWSSLLAFAENGGTVIILEQESIPENPLRVKLSEHSSTITIPITLNCSLFRGLNLSDFRFWRGDHYVSYRDLVPPVIAPSFSLVSSGIGLKYSQLLEVRCGKGAVIFCQMLLVSKFREEPRARILLARLLDYYTDYRPAVKKAGVLEKATSLLDVLKTMGARVKPISLNDLSEVELVLTTADAISSEAVQSLREFCINGGILYVYEVSEENLNLLKEIAGVNLTIVRGHPPVVFSKEDFAKLLNNNLLYWIKKERLKRHGPYMLDESIASKVILEETKAINLTEVDLNSFKVVKGDKRLIGVSEKKVLYMYGNGVVSAKITVAEPGYYIITVDAHGTPVHGIYPVMEIWVNREKASSIEVSKRSNYSTVVYLEKGTHVLSIAFVNDEWIPGKEDRNLYIHKVVYGKIKSLKIIPLASPCVLAKIPLGKGFIIVDQVPWLNVTNELGNVNYFKAVKYSYQLLSLLGVQFNPLNIIVVEPTDFKPGKGLIDISSERVGLYSNGYVSALIELPSRGNYSIVIIARGNYAKGEWPLAEIRLNETLLGEIRVNNSSWRRYSLKFSAERGVYELKIYFTNDYYNPPKEDRNLYIKLVVVVKEEEG